MCLCPLLLAVYKVSKFLEAMSALDTYLSVGDDRYQYWLLQLLSLRRFDDEGENDFLEQLCSQPGSSVGEHVRHGCVDFPMAQIVVPVVVEEVDEAQRDPGLVVRLGDPRDALHN